MNLNVGDTSETYIWYFWPHSFQGDWVTFSSIVSKWGVTRQRLAVEQNELEFATRDANITIYEVPLTL